VTRCVSLRLHLVVIVHYLMARTSIVLHVVIGGVCVFGRCNLEHISLIHGSVDWHDLFCENGPLQVSMQIRLVLSILLNNLLHVASHVNICRETLAPWSRPSTRSNTLEVFVLLTKGRLMQGWH